MNNKLLLFPILLSIIFFIIAVVLFSDVSFLFIGMGISIIGITILYKINH